MHCVLIFTNVLNMNAKCLVAGYSICYNTNNWDLISKYATKFLSARVKLRPSTFDIWMEFAAKLGIILYPFIFFRSNRYAHVSCTNMIQFGFTIQSDVRITKIKVLWSKGGVVFFALLQFTDFELLCTNVVFIAVNFFLN